MAAVLFSFLFHFIPLSVALQFRIGSSRLLEVVDSSGEFRPICSSSVTDEYLRIACSVDSSSQLPELLPWRTNGLVSITCVHETSCYTTDAPECSQGILVTCSKFQSSQDHSKALCGPRELFTDGKCFRIETRQFSSFNVAKERCSIEVASISSSSSRNTISSAISALYDSSLIYFTSGFRQGSKWIWQDGSIIEPSPTEGSGRCLAWVKGEWKGIDCDSSGSIICQSMPNCINNGKYGGTHNITKQGQPCLRWNDPSVLFHGIKVNGQENWDHNYCRMVGKTPSCFSSPERLTACDIAKCPFIEISAEKSKGCGGNEFHCDNGKCIADDFRCDYERDCEDGSDEVNCKDYLRAFELVGALKLTTKITEVWSHIPHVQGCAKRCEESTILCESFSYEPRSQNCFLSDAPANRVGLSNRQTSQFYRRRFSPKDVEFTLSGHNLMAVRNDTWRVVCDNDFSLALLTAVCSTAGFGLPLTPLVKKEQVLGWQIECLRDPTCYIAKFCYPIRCSQCQNAVCDDGTCLTRDRLCDGRNDCRDGSDEKECQDPAFRTSGEGLDLFLHGKWESVCSDGFREDSANFVCHSLSAGAGDVMSSVELNKPGRQLMCKSSQSCSIGPVISCPFQARVRCSSIAVTDGAQCGTRKVQVNARDAAIARFARVVGGFEATPGSFPWTAALRMRDDGSHHCGAAILDEMHVITAAHCFEEDRRPRSYTIVAGDWDNNVTEGTEQFATPVRIFFYPLFENLFTHDLAIIELAEPGFIWTDWVQPICLPEKDFNYDAGRKCTVSGWGSIGLDFPQRLQAASLPIIDRQQCTNSSKIYESMSRTAFCAGYLKGGIDSCQGDSGGPYACENGSGQFVLAGVISWGDGCAQQNQPGIYTMVAPYLTWIEEILRKRTTLNRNFQ